MRRDLTKDAREGKLDPVKSAAMKEIRAHDEVLSRRSEPTRS